jgi:hypothetical protein
MQVCAGIYVHRKILCIITETIIKYHLQMKFRAYLNDQRFLGGLHAQDGPAVPSAWSVEVEGSTWTTGVKTMPTLEDMSEIPIGALQGF